MSDWQTAAKSLWGDDWIAPLSEFLAINRRTIERYRAGDGDLSPALASQLCTLARRAGADAPHVGGYLREMARGASIQAISADMASRRRAMAKIEHMADTLALMRRGDWPT